ncbi:hypothetical protein CSB37_02120 [bacterium DOLZORAL124_38_8]|nr:MAG: hypothetical protein CSB37_02120 [bacterium DOLZORAL124_38_8]
MKNLNIILILSAVLLFGFVGLPKKRAVDTLQKEIQTLQQTKQQKTTKFKAVKKEFEALQASKDSIKHFIPTEFNQGELITDIKKLSQKAGVTVSDAIQFSKTTEANGLQKLSTQFSVTGFRSQILLFLKSVESNPLLMGVENFAIEKNEDDQTTFGVNLYSYYFESQPQTNEQ